MPVRSEDRATVNLGKDLILAARERAYAQAWARIIKSSGFQPQ